MRSLGKEPVAETVRVELSDENKRSLLKDASKRALGRRSEAETILKRLVQLNAELAKQFQYKESALGNLTLRMLCSSDATAAQDPGAHVLSFLAVSYCWHSGDWDAAQAARPLTTWGLSYPMVSKILSLRESKDEGVWVDQLCIDQKNKDEQEIAIGSMDVIYRAARQLVIALEDVQLDKKEEEVGLKYASMYETMCLAIRKTQPSESEKTKMVEELFKHDHHDLDDTVEFLLKMLNARWYSRAWCAHESKVSSHGKTNNPLFLCFGSAGSVLSFEFRFVHFLAFHMWKYPELPFPRGGEFFQVLDAPAETNTLLQGSSKIDNLLPDHHPDSSLMTYLVTISSFDCLYKTDMIAIAINSSRIPLVFRGSIDPAFPEIRFWIFALLALASGDVGPLLLQARNLYFLDEKRGSKAISWVDLPHNALLEMRLPILSTDSIHSATMEYIELDLYLFTGMPKKASEASLAKARSILQTFSLMNRAHTLGAEDTAYTGAVAETAVDVMAHRGLDTKWFEEVVGSAIDNGIDWIRRLPSILGKETESGRWGHGKFGSFEPGFTKAAIDLLSYFNVTKESNDDFDVEFLDPIIRFFTCVTDHRLKFPVLLPRKITTRVEGDFAFTYQTSDRSWIAVPVAVAHLPFYENRAWVVEPGQKPYVPEMKDPPSNPTAVTDIFPVLTADLADRRDPQNAEGTWCLRKRQTLVGCQPIVADGKAVVLLKKQKVYGGEDYDWAAMSEQYRVMSERANL
ncbi:MAG: hypothetical protein M1839_000478 [Geoglossum umbratile]|nr:MAG: hypothetical protein M1839_000478 [Geoglossum umbratile]